MLFPKIILKFLCFLAIFQISCGRVDIPDEVATAKVNLPENIDFNIHVKPILSDRCFACHGPDKNNRQGDLRLDIEKGAYASLTSGNGKAVIPGKLHKSELFHRILSDDPEYKMPPDESNLFLTHEEKAILIKWIEQGAVYKPHWAFIPPEILQIPEIHNKEWKVNNPIDNFILSSLEKKGLTPAPEANKERLLRRVTLDLTGLPPTIEEIDHFLQNNSLDAYEKVVDRLLNSEAYAERMAMEWMDIARYADSHGMHADGWRYMWPWRDWVIKAFKENMPYDQFSTWQMAGDLLPDATKEQILATAFNRNHPMTAEGGVIDEEFRLQYVFDRTNTIGTAFLGLTLECAKCHDHKFDPITQEDYYKMSAFFNNVKEIGMTGDDGNFGPMLLLSDTETDLEIQKYDDKIKDKQKEVQVSIEKIQSIKSLISKPGKDLKINGLVAYLPFDKLQEKVNSNGKKELIIDNNPASKAPGNPQLVEGRFGNALQFQNEYDEVYLEKVGNFEINEPFSVSLWVNTSKKEKGKTQVLIGNAGNKNIYWRGWDFYLDTLNQLSARLIHSLPHNYIHVSSDVVPLNTWSHVAFTYDGSATAEGLSLYINGEKTETTIHYDRLYKTIKTIAFGGKINDVPLRIGKSYRAFTGENGIFKGKLDEIKIFDRQLTSYEMSLLGGNEGNLNEESQKQYLVARDKNYQKQLQELKKLRQEKLQLINDIPEIMVMEEMKEPKATFVLDRGQYDAPTQKVEPATPESISVFPDTLPKDRLGLSKWLFSKNNPLTARVTVNRYWQMIFGQGLVKTSEDFGNQGNLPVHPELLDWMAVYFQESGWDLQKLLNTLVMSATYRQSSAANKELQAKDPDNQWLARGPSHRLQAEMIRDNALAASGLLVKQMGGESVKPYQPEGLWKEKNNFSHVLLDYIESKGDSLYRRSLYTFIRRTSPHPAMIAFDAGPRDVCTVRRETTNTPLQALVLLNDPQFVEAARVMAERIQMEGGKNIEDQLVLGFRLATGRKPKSSELDIIKNLYHSQVEVFKKEPGKAEELLNVGEFKSNNKLDKVNTAALAVVTNTLLNHDESYTKR
ncbi:DUF1553 domain-containing protein [soil metagenome]